MPGYGSSPYEMTREIGLKPSTPKTTDALSDLEMEDLLDRVRYINVAHNVGLKTIRQKYIKIKDILDDSLDILPDDDDECYKLIEGDGDRLEKNISTFLSNGWRLHGQPFLGNNRNYVQAIVRDTEKKSETVIKE